jgi:hypothetical protein
MSMMDRHVEFLIRKPSSSLVIAIKPKAITDIRTSAIILFYVLQKKNALIKVVYF